MRTRSLVPSLASSSMKSKTSCVHLPDESDWLTRCDDDLESVPFLSASGQKMFATPPKVLSSSESSPFQRRLFSNGDDRCSSKRKNRAEDFSRQAVDASSSETSTNLYLQRFSASERALGVAARRRLCLRVFCWASCFFLLFFVFALLLDLVIFGGRRLAEERCESVPELTEAWRSPLETLQWGGNRTRQSDLRFWGSHNSYHRAPKWRDFPWLGALVPGWAYSHAGLAKQLDLGARHLELDVHVDSLTRQVTVYHVPSLDPGTRCFCLVSCAKNLLRWSNERQNRHSLIFILLEPKGARYFFEDARSHARGFGTDDLETTTVLNLIDDAIFHAFKDQPELLFTPRDLLRRQDASLADAVTSRGWPAHDSLVGKFAFALLDSTPQNILTRSYCDNQKNKNILNTMDKTKKKVVVSNDDDVKKESSSTTEDNNEDAAFRLLTSRFDNKAMFAMANEYASSSSSPKNKRKRRLQEEEEEILTPDMMPLGSRAYAHAQRAREKWSSWTASWKTNATRHRRPHLVEEEAAEVAPKPSAQRKNSDLDVAIYKLDNPKRIGFPEDIQDAVQKGFIVRTRANTMRRPYDNIRFAKTKASGAQLVTFEADTAAHWRRFIGPGGNRDAQHLCACDDVALRASSGTFSRLCDANNPPCY